MPGTSVHGYTVLGQNGRYSIRTTQQLRTPRETREKAARGDSRLTLNNCGLTSRDGSIREKAEGFKEAILGHLGAAIGHPG